jgi:predicted DNA-binding helix-hairpin-helix protein
LAKIAAKKTFKQTILSRLSNDLQMPTVDILRELTKSKRQSLLQLPETKIISSFDKYFEDRAILKRNYAFVPSSITVDRIVIEDTTNDLIIRPRVQNNFEEFQK